MNTPTEHGQAIAEVIELTLASLERVAPTTRTIDLCGIAENIIEVASGYDKRWDHAEWELVYQAVRDESPRYREAVRAYEAQRMLERVA